MNWRTQIDNFLEPFLSIIYLKQCIACSGQCLTTYQLFCPLCQNEVLHNLNSNSLYNGHLVLFDPIEPILALLDFASKENYYAQELINSFFKAALYNLGWNNDSIQLQSETGKLKYNYYLKKLENINTNTKRYITLIISPSDLNTYVNSTIAITYS